MAKAPVYSTSFLSIYFVFAALEVLLMSGITYGWASIAFLFKEEGFFGFLCQAVNRTLESSQESQEKNEACLPQEQRLNLVFNVGVALLCGSKLLIGAFTDRYGPRFSQMVGGFLYVSAGFGLAFTTKENSNVLFFIFSTFCVGGGFIAVAKYQVSRIIYRKSKSLALSVLHGAFDSSAAVLLIFKVIHERGVSMKLISLFYTSLCLVLIIISTILLTPSHKTLLAIVKEEEMGDAVKEIAKSRRYSATESIDSISFPDEHAYKSIHQKILRIPETLKESICFPLYIYELLFLSVMQLKLWFYIGSLEELLKIIFKNDSESVDYYTTLFGYMQLCGILTGPVVGCIFDRGLIKFSKSYNENETLLLASPIRGHLIRMKQSILPFLLTSMLGIILSLLSIIKWKPGLIISFVLHVVIRGFLYASHAAFIGLAFKPQYFGTLYGLGIFLAGLVGLLEYFLYTVTHIWLYGDPFLINLVLLVLVVLTTIYVYHLTRHCKRIEEDIHHSVLMYGTETHS
ncbi:equilibrative nucleobase transporter 1-like [Rhopilema esculentum]|uniref:equilibrative nucleobase transporter 1-like n=1 Tax=Rhopilema esculentum TaxID=499914 RepID=UPI0031D4B5BE